MNIFQRKKISGNIFVNEEISGVFEYKLAPVVDSEWDNVNTVTDVHLYGHHANLDFQQRLMQISAIVSTIGFNNLSVVEKDICGIYSIPDDNTLITHYATAHTAGDVLAALEIHAGKIAEFVVEMNKVATNRIENAATKREIMKYLKDRSQIDLFIAATRNFISDYKFKFHLGTMYNDSTDGIMDYIENTGGYSSPQTGLDSYEFSDLYKQVWYNTNAVDPNNPTQTEQDNAHTYVKDLLKVELVNILLYGIIT